ncbi:MAG TPA: hypothetical protein V6C52_02805 [Coleofasciculaceae cyanobacterium]|jgi:hypothetical protein
MTVSTRLLTFGSSYKLLIPHELVAGDYPRTRSHEVRGMINTALMDKGRFSSNSPGSKVDIYYGHSGPRNDDPIVLGVFTNDTIGSIEKSFELADRDKKSRSVALSNYFIHTPRENIFSIKNNVDLANFIKQLFKDLKIQGPEDPSEAWVLLEVKDGKKKYY